MPFKDLMKEIKNTPSLKKNPTQVKKFGKNYCIHEFTDEVYIIPTENKPVKVILENYVEVVETFPPNMHYTVKIKKPFGQLPDKIQEKIITLISNDTKFIKEISIENGEIVNIEYKE